MKKLICLLLTLITIVSLITSCDSSSDTEPPAPPTHTHSFSNATCQSPKTCSTCGETEGTLGSHSNTNGICSVCNLDIYEEFLSTAKKYPGITFDEWGFNGPVIAYEKDALTFKLFITKESVSTGNYNWLLVDGNHWNFFHGTVTANEFPESNSITCDGYIGNENLKLVESAMGITIYNELNDILGTSNKNLKLTDLGFKEK